MHCPSCGDENPATTRFCIGCGRVLVEDARRKRKRRRRPEPDAPRAKVAEPWSGPSVPRRSVPPAPLSAAVAMAVVALAIGAYLLLPGHPAASESEPAPFVPLPYKAEAADPVANAGPSVAVPESATTSAHWTAVLPDRAPPRDDRLVDPARAEAVRAAARKAPSPVPEPAPAAPERAAEPAPPVAIAAVAPTPSVRPRSPRQDLDEALARCQQEDGLGRFVCDQKARLAYCEGRWGRDEQCPSGRTADYGQ